MACTQLPGGEKSAFIALVQAAPYPGGPDEAARLESILNCYEDITWALYRQKNLFASNNGYLTQALSCFTNSNLQAVGIWFNYNSSSPPLDNPVLIVNSTITDDVVIGATSPPSNLVLTIMGSSTLSRIVVTAGTNLNQLYIGPGVEVDALDSSAINASVGVLWLPNLKNNPSRLNIAVADSQILQIIQDPGSYFGGYSNVDPDNSCATEIQNLAYGIITHNTISLTWGQSPPNAYLFINTYYRIQGSNVWILADETVGLFNGDSGFTFNNLNCDTTYQFMVTITCLNGAVTNSGVLTIATTAAPCA